MWYEMADRYDVGSADSPLKTPTDLYWPIVSHSDDVSQRLFQGKAAGVYRRSFDDSYWSKAKLALKPPRRRCELWLSGKR